MSSHQQHQQHHPSTRTTAAVQTGGERAGQPHRPVRQPLGVKNSMPNSASRNNSTKGELIGEEAYPIKPIPHSHLAPPARFRRPAAATAATTTSSPLVNTPSTTTPSTNQRIYTSHHPSPLGLKTEELPGSDGGTSSSSQLTPAPLSPSIIKTPKKRAIPVEDVHVRNTVPGHQVDALDGPSQSPNPNKRSRSSKHGSSATDPSTSTSLSIATGMGDVNLQSQGAASNVVVHHQDPLPPPLPTHHAVQPTHAHAHVHSHPSRSIVPPPHPRQTTTRIDKQSRMTENDRLQRERQKMEAQREWRKKFLKAFPLFHFHLDGFDEALRKEITGIIEQLGGTIEPFFSNNVSHLITTRKVPLGAIPDAQTGPLALVLPSPRGGETGRSTASAGTSRSASTATTAAASIRPLPGPNRLSRLPALRKKNTGFPLHSDRNPFEECGPALPANDILVKARNFGMKVWTLDKFRTVISNLLGVEVNTDPKKQQSLSQMLEKAPHLIERDITASRDNFHFFSKNTAYILVEDATGEHRPIMVQEWTKPATENDAVPWPVLYGQLEGRCPFTKFDFEGDLRKRMKPNRHETLKRSVSMSHLTRGGLAHSPAPSGDSRGSYSINRGASPYPLASGNSVSLTSNIASTTSTAMTGPSGLGLIPPYGALGRKVNQASTIGLGRPSTTASNARSSHSSTAPGGGSVTALNEQARGSLVRRMLGITEQTRNNNLSMVRRSVSTASAGHQLRREKKPGYCENCRSKYDDFDEHIAGRKHRKFAEDDSQFTEIDTLLNRVCRPIAAWAMGASSTPGSTAEAEVSSNSSLLAAGGSLLEVEGAEGEGEESSLDRLQHLRSPRGFMDVMHQWQQSTQKVDHPEEGYSASLSSPFSHHSPAPAAATLDLEEDCAGTHDDYGEHGSTSSHGGQTTAGNTTATTIDHQTEEEMMISQSPDTSPHIHHQYHHLHQHHHEKQEQDDSFTASYYGTAI